MSQITIARIEPTSLAEVAEFLNREWAAFDRELLDGDDASRWERQRHLLHALVDGQTVAVASFYLLGGVAHLSEIIVAQAWRNRGIGAQMMARFEAMARAAGCHKLSLRTPETSPAARLYRRLGYEVEGKMINHFHGLTFLQFSKFLVNKTAQP